MRKVAFLVANDTFPEDPSIPPLHFTQNDASELAKVLEDPETCAFETRLYLNETSHKVLADLEQISGDLEADDTLLFYYAGHGKLRRDGQLCLASKDTTMAHLGARSIRAREVLAYLQESHARRRLLILDCCQSGAIGREFRGDDLQSSLAGLADSFGSYVLTASTAIQLAEEREKDGHGVFTKALIDCLREGGKEIITVNDWYEYAYRQLRALANQTPMKWGLEEQGPSFEIGNFRAKHERERQRERERLDQERRLEQERLDRERLLEQERLERERQQERGRLISTARARLGAYLALGELSEEQVEEAAALLKRDEARLFPRDRKYRDDLIRFSKGEASFLEVFGLGHIWRPEPAPKPPEDEVGPPISPPEVPRADSSPISLDPAVVEEPVTRAESSPTIDQPVTPDQAAPLGLTGNGVAVKELKRKPAAQKAEPISATRTMLLVGLAVAIALLGGLFYLDSTKKAEQSRYQATSTSNLPSVESTPLIFPSAKPTVAAIVPDKPSLPSSEQVPSILPLAIPPAASAQTFQTSAPHAILIDAATRSVLFEKDADALVVPASTAKIMTAEIVFHEITLGHLKLDDQFVVSKTAWRLGGAPARGPSMFAAPNSIVRVEDLIRGLVIVSGNDAAIALAEGIAGSEGAFATLMTKRARELGLEHSTFTNAWGRADPEQKVTPTEMVMLANHIIQTYPNYYKYFGEKDFTWNKIKQANRNPLLTMHLGADGLKTGNIDESGYGLVGSAVQNGQRLILALYGSPTAKERADEARKIFLWGFSRNRPSSRNEIHRAP